jgi:hypothetical protein
MRLALLAIAAPFALLLSRPKLVALWTVREPDARREAETEPARERLTEPERETCPNVGSRVPRLSSKPIAPMP